MESETSVGKKEEHPRIYRLDNARAVLIFCVVLGHLVTHNTADSAVCRSVYIFIYAFHMPLFIFIAGYLHRNKNIKDKAVFYAMLGVALRLFIFALKNILQMDSWDLELFENEGIPWFMYAMAVYVVLTYILSGYDRRVVLAAALLLGCFAGYDPDINDILVLSRIIVFFPFYWAGYCAQGLAGRLRQFFSGQKKKKRKRLLFLCGVLLLAGWAALCIFRLPAVYELRPFFSGRHPFEEEYAETFLGFLTRALCYFISAATGLAVLAVVPGKRLPVLTRTGERSLAVYFWHRPVIYILTETGVLNFFFRNELGAARCFLLALLMVLLLGTRPFAVPLDKLKAAIRTPADASAADTE